MTDTDNTESINAGDVDRGTEATSDTQAEAQAREDELLAAAQVDMAMREALQNQFGENIDAEGVNDYYDVFDWDPNPTATDYYAMALRNPYAYAVTFLPSMTSWRDPPRIVDDAEAGENETAFESDVDDLLRDHDLWSYASRADMLAGIGTFGVLVLEFDDVEQDDVGDGDPKEGFGAEVNGATGLQGLRPYSRESIEEVKLGGPGSGRWGEPIRYELDLSDENDEEFAIDEGGPDSMWVHHSRVIHIHSDQLLDDEVRGIPRQQPVYNNLVDIEKTLGSAGELAYRASAWGININIAPEFDVEDNGEKMREHLARWQSGLENVLRTHGADDVKSLGGEDIDPQPVIDPNVEAISAQTGIPQSVLKGNETGERATTQDLKEWYGKIQERREQFVTPTIVRELIDRLIEYSVVSPPSNGAGSYSVEWTPLHELSQKDQAEIQHTRAQALKKWTGGMPEAMLTRQQQAEYIEDGILPSEFDEAPDDAAALEEASAAADGARDVEEMTAKYGTGEEAVADGGEVDDE
ncbi:anti-CBASS protein Acb1 family protein [Halorubrum coriense]|nr:anti-CBASS Acb1 family protein [Halorubrum coriense]QRG24114.1 portal protein [Halorubrum virus Humcor1]